MICPILTAIEIIDEAKAIFDVPAGKKAVVHKGGNVIQRGDSARLAGSIVIYAAEKPNHHRLHELAPRIVMLRECTDCPRELVEEIRDLVDSMIRNKSLVGWKMTERPARAIYSPEALEKAMEDLTTP